MDAESIPKSAVRSCTTCSKAKARCVRRVGEDVCERCARLKKECQSREPVLKRRKPMKTTRAAQLEKLESKIENLVNALSTQQPIASIASRSDYGQPSPPISLQSQVTSDRTANRTNDILNVLCCDTRQQELPLESNNRRSVVTLSEAETLLSRYRRLMSAGMPFVPIPPSMTAQDLYRTKPVLLRAITTVALIHDLPRQQLLVKELLRDLSERIMMRGEKSVDLLQAIIIIVAWYYPHIFWNFQITNLLYLAAAMTIDLGFDKRREPCKADFNATTPVHQPSMEETRTLLGLFYLTSNQSSSFKKFDAMPFTRHMQDCLYSLEQSHEYESDRLAAQMVRVQRIIESIHTTDTSNVPAKVYNKAFQKDIERERETDPCKEDNMFLRLQYLTAEILTWELSLNELVDDKTRPRVRSVLDDLYRCVSAIKAFLELFFTIPSSAYLLLPFSVIGQFAHAIIVLTKLASLDVEGWDLKALDDQISFSHTIDEASRRFEEATQSPIDGLVVQNDSFGKWAQRMRWMKQVYETKFSEIVESVPKHTRPLDNNFGQPTPPDDHDILNADFFNYLDNDFWSTVDFTTDMAFTSTTDHGLGT